MAASPGVSVRADDGGLHVRTTAASGWDRVLRDPPLWVGGEIAKAVAPCLSPDGRRIAHFTELDSAPVVAILELEQVGDRSLRSR